jgi:phosphatidylglycerophosphate synthase
MFDGILRHLIDPPLDATGRALTRRGISADQATLAGLACGLACAAAVAAGHDWAALGLLCLSRLLDGLDGALARASTPTDRGGFLDITCDFIFYGAVPLAFALRDPAANALPVAVLLFAFYVNGASFLAFAVMAAKRGLTTTRRGAKSLYFTAGLAEGAETIACFAAMMLWPDWFPALAYGFAALTMVTAASRMILAWTTFAERD